MAELKRSHIYFMYVEDDLVQQFKNLRGKYLTKYGYQAMIFEGEDNSTWWFKKLWNIKGPSKRILFFCLVLKE
jgi:hypothetical protein